MNALQISWKSLRANPLSAMLNILLIAFGTGILTILLLASGQVNDKLQSNSRDIDLVVGAKGSPLQLILSSIYHIDFPTGNIPLAEAEKLAQSPLIKRAVPLGLGDNYNGFRIVGTDTGFIGLYDLQLASGKFWQDDMEVTVGANVAKKQKLSVGTTFFGGHGLTQNAEKHADKAYKVAGILKPSGNVSDNLVLTSISSVWRMHDHEDHTGAGEEPEREITSLLIQYHSPMSVILFPRIVNQSTNMQAASPALESARLFSLIGIGVETLQWFAILIMSIAAISVFVSLYNSLKERRYDLAIMRTMGASRGKLFIIIMLEGFLLTLVGTVLGLALGHLAMELIGTYQDSDQARVSGLVFSSGEWLIAGAGLLIGLLAAAIPSVQAYRSDISRILSKS